MNSSTNLRKPGKFVNAPVMKKDAMALVTGKPVYMDDVAPKDCLVVKVLRSPHAHALIKEIRTDLAEKVERYCLCTDLQRCSKTPLYHGRTDLSGAESV